ncbi:MAG: tRNA nuclease WapA precursor [Firmicutes bacterium ADurb.Bin182]|nr:MAG: tRNA nuclease WapA precursor [Firmicutes bacterium ADurb.Bin182]
MNYNGSVYFYVRNAQNDIVSIVDSTGTVVVTYSYDAWGKLFDVSGAKATTLGKDNPFRYRGYYFDSETGLYYLQSRYYNPEWGRFINADVYVSTGQGLLASNMFAYCANNPVMFSDEHGYRYAISAGIGGLNAEDRARKEMKDLQSLKGITGYVNDQRKLPGLQLGSKGNLPKHGCGVVAVHNAIVLTGKESNLYDVIYVF